MEHRQNKLTPETLVDFILFGDGTLDKANATELVRRWNAFEKGGFVLDLLGACEQSSKLLRRWKSGDCDNKAAIQTAGE